MKKLLNNRFIVSALFILVLLVMVFFSLAEPLVKMVVTAAAVLLLCYVWIILANDTRLNKNEREFLDKLEDWLYP